MNVTGAVREPELIEERVVNGHPEGPSDKPIGERPRSSLLARLLVAPIRLYQLTAAMRPPRCRFLPTCSAYAVQALRTHGAFKGSWLAVRRLGRCHPWNPGGIDPVPPRK